MQVHLDSGLFQTLSGKDLPLTARSEASSLPHSCPHVFEAGNEANRIFKRDRKIVFGIIQQYLLL